MVVIFSTFPNKEVAQSVIESLLSKRLIACGSVLGSVESSYWWQGKIERAQEFQALMKAPKSHYEEIEALIKKEHPYDVPEVFCVEAAKVEKRYERWLIEETKHVS